MIRYTQGNLLEADADALVNTVNTVGVMGKGVALMFKDAFPDNFRAYAAACQRGEVKVGEVFVFERADLLRPRWILNFPTKEHWRGGTRPEWIDAGLRDLVRVVRARAIRTLALPPLGCGNGGLRWDDVRPRIARHLESLNEVNIIVHEPTPRYQNVQKRTGVERLTPARAMIVDLVRRYAVLGFNCSILEIQKLAWLLENTLIDLNLNQPPPLDLRYQAGRYGPYAPRLMHLLNKLDGSYLGCDKRLADAEPMDRIWFNHARAAALAAYLACPEASTYQPALARVEHLIDGFQSPLGLELLATVDWLLRHTHCAPTVPAVRQALATWPGGPGAAARKQRLFDNRLIRLAIERLAPSSVMAAQASSPSAANNGPSCA